MTASSNTKFSSEDKNANKNSTAETRRASKPLMEKRRRARINQSLAILKSLIVDTQRVEGKQAKLEKADILEMTVEYLQNVKKSDEQKFIQGFEECFSEATRFLEKTKIDSTVVDKLTDHLKKFQQNLDLSVSLNEEGTVTLTTTVSESNSATSGVEDNRPVKLLPFPPTHEPLEPSSAPFALNVPRYKTETPTAKGMRKAPSSTHSRSSYCLSPAFSNDSNNNNNFVPEVDGFRQHHISEHGYPHSGSVESFERIRPSPDSTSTTLRPLMTVDNSYALNLSTHNTTNNSSFNYCNISPRIMDSRHDDDGIEPMEEEPVDFSKPLNLCKHPVGYRLSEDGVWRPW